MRGCWLVILAFLTACAAPAEQLVSPPADAEAPASGLWRFGEAAPALREASCPAGTPYETFQPIDFNAQPLGADEAAAISRRVPEGARLTGSWRLSSSNPNFGGISGLAILPDNRLLAVTDTGAWISLRLVSGEPVAAEMGYLRGAGGRLLRGKAESDAEGLIWRDGIALVSFEQDHRIKAYDLSGCGSAARGVPVASLPDRVAGNKVHPNLGAEGLTLTADGQLLFAYEAPIAGGSPLGTLTAAGEAYWTGETLGNPRGYALTGLESFALPGRAEMRVTLFRSYDPFRGARVILRWAEGEAGQISLSRPVLTDNFEGLAVEPAGVDRVRVWIVSDDNFSASQETLLFRFEITLPP
jgi:hypothetical protein